EELGLNEGVEGKTFIIQGLGNVGYSTAKNMIQAGAKMVGVAEIEGSIYDENGIDLHELMEFRKETGSILGFENTEELEDNTSVLTQKCDILIPAALRIKSPQKMRPIYKRKYSVKPQTVLQRRKPIKF